MPIPPVEFARAHLLDRVFARFMGRPPLFRQGWGDVDALAAALGDAPFLPAAGAITPHLAAPRAQGAIERVDGHFTSPLPGLSPEVARARLRWLRPLGARGRAACVLLAGSRDEGLGLRTQIFAPLVADGVDLVILENPFYGTRRPHGQEGAAIRTVADHLRMNVASVEEARALVAWLRREGYARVGVAGYSMGGYMAALAAAVSREPTPVAVLAGGRSPVPVFADGLLARGIAFAALGGRDATRARLGELFAQAALDRHPPPAGAPALIVGCAHDGYVPRSETLALHAHWPAAELRWLDAGHVSALFTERAALRAAVRDVLGTPAAHRAS